MKRTILMFALVISALEAEVNTAAAQTYHVAGTIDFDGRGYWDYLVIDTASGRLFATNDTRVHVANLSTRAACGVIDGLHGVHGIALVPDAGAGFISNGGNGTVTVFDLTTLAKTAEIRVTGSDPDAIVYDPFTRRVFTFNGGGNSATAIDVKTRTVAGTVKLGGKPEYAVSDGKGRMYVNLEDESAVAVFDPRTCTVLATWPLGPCKTPTGMAIDREHGRLFITGRNKIMAVLDAATGSLLASLPIGSGVDGCAFDPATRLAFASNGEGTLTVVRERTPGDFAVVQTVTTLPRARTLALDERTHALYLTTVLPDRANGHATAAKRQHLGVLILAAE